MRVERLLSCLLCASIGVFGCENEESTGEGNKVRIKWERFFRTSSRDWFATVIEGAEGTTVAVGHKFEGDGTANIWLVRLGVSGEVRWERVYRDPAAEFGFSIEELRAPGGGLIIVGTREGEPSATVLVLKVDPEGELEWKKTLAPGKRTKGAFVKEVESGNLLVVGQQVLELAGSDVYVAKLTGGGTTLWEATFGGNKDDRGMSCAEVDGGNGYIITGESNSSTFLGNDVYLTEIDRDGRQVWERTYGGEGDQRGDIVRRARSGDYVILGSTHDWMSPIGVYLLKTSRSGRAVWERSVRDEHRSYVGIALRTCADEGCIAAARIVEDELSPTEVLFLKIDGGGEVVSQREENVFSERVVRDLFFLNEQEYVLLGEFARRVKRKGACIMRASMPEMTSTRNP